MPAVVRSHRQLVDEHPIDGVKHFDREHAGHVEGAGDLEGNGLRLESTFVIEIRTRCDNLTAHAVDLHRPDHGIGDRLSMG